MQIVLLSHKEEWSKFMLERVRSSVPRPEVHGFSSLIQTRQGETLFLYLTVSELAVSEVLIRGGIQKPVYYISKSLLDTKIRYQIMEKMALALFVVSRKLKHYF